MVSKINTCIDEHCTHFYTALVNDKLVEMVEINADNLYSYFEMDNERKLPRLDKLG